MEKDNKILVGAVIIILVALVAFNLSKITGQVTKETTTITVNPKIIGAGDIISISVVPGSEGAENEMRIYYEDENGNLIRKVQQHEMDRKTGGRLTRGITFSYRTYSTWVDGKYYVVVEDKATGEDIFASFKIRS